MPTTVNREKKDNEREKEVGESLSLSHEWGRRTGGRAQRRRQQKTLGLFLFMSSFYAGDIKAIRREGHMKNIINNIHILAV